MVWAPVCGTVLDEAPRTFGNACQFQGAVRRRAGDKGQSKGFFRPGKCPTPRDPTYCNTDADCTVTALRKDIASAADCYCTFCPTTVVNVATAKKRSADYQAHCGHLTSDPAACPVVRCMQPPRVACQNNTCVAVPSPGV